jgi:hypothetical protein
VKSTDYRPSIGIAVWTRQGSRETPRSTALRPWETARSRTSSIGPPPPEVRRDDGRIGADVLRRALGDLPARAEHRDGVGDLHDEADHVLDDDDGDALVVADPAQELDRVIPRCPCGSGCCPCRSRCGTNWPLTPRSPAPCWRSSSAACSPGSVAPPPAPGSPTPRAGPSRSFSASRVPPAAGPHGPGDRPAPGADPRSRHSSAAAPRAPAGRPRRDRSRS